MTLQEIKLLHAFNAWASHRIFESVASLPEADYVKDLKSSHGGIHGTLTHMVGAEKIWLSRWIGKPEATLLSIRDVAGVSDLRGVWEKTGLETARYLGTLTDKKLAESFSFTNAKGESLTQRTWQSIQHVVDHSTYHRGQVVSMLRQLGAQPPSTGLIMFYRETSKLKG